MTQTINAFPTYEIHYNEKKKQWDSWYRGINLGRGGWAYSIPGIYSNVVLSDAASMHPTSIEMLNKLGKYTKRYSDLKRVRVLIKHKEYDKAKELFDGKLAPYLDDPSTAKALSKALKLPINAFYGISTATFSNPARDSRDKNNIIAARGAVFMKTLWDAIEEKGYHPIHSKTDSIKVPNAPLEMVEFIHDFGLKYGYEMEHEGTYERICLIDKSNYVAAFMRPEECMKRYGYVPADNAEHFANNSHPWTETGDNFKHPYIFKTLFSGEPVTFKDMCEAKSVQKDAIYLDMNEDLEDTTEAEKEIERRRFNRNNPNEKPKKLNESFRGWSDEDVLKFIDDNHKYVFVGRVGSFFPVRPGIGGGLLVTKRENKYVSITGAKGYRWMESEKAKMLKLEKDYDQQYFDSLIDTAIASINKFGSFERFIDLSRPYESPEQPTQPMPEPDDDDCPFSLVPCGDNKYNTCMDCPRYQGEDICRAGYSLASYVHDNEK